MCICTYTYTDTHAEIHVHTYLKFCLYVCQYTHRKQTQHTVMHKHRNPRRHIPVSAAAGTEAYRGISYIKPHSADVSTCLELLSLSNRNENLQMSLSHEKWRCNRERRIEFVGFGKCVCSLGVCVSALVGLFVVCLLLCMCVYLCVYINGVYICLAVPNVSVLCGCINVCYGLCTCVFDFIRMCDCSGVCVCMCACK